MKTGGKNYENPIKLKDNVNILLNMLNWHGMKYISSVKCLDYSASCELMAWTIMVSTARIQKCSKLEANFGKVMFELDTSCVWF